MGNKLLTTLSNMFTNPNLTDMESRYKLFITKQLKPLLLKVKRFGLEPEVLAKIARIQDIIIYEAGISYYGQDIQGEKKTVWKDGILDIYCVLRYNVLGRKYLK